MNIPQRKEIRIELVENGYSLISTRNHPDYIQKYYAAESKESLHRVIDEILQEFEK